MWKILAANMALSRHLVQKDLMDGLIDSQEPTLQFYTTGQQASVTWNPSTELIQILAVQCILTAPPAFLKQYLHRFDVLVLNTGHHWNRGKLTGNRWVMHVNGMPNTDRKMTAIGNAKNLTVHSIAKWIDSQLPQYPQLKVIFRTIWPRHFANGDWNTGGHCDNTKPMSGGSDVTKDGSDDPVIEDAVKGTRIKLLDITALSQLRDEGHVSKYSIRAQPGMV